MGDESDYLESQCDGGAAEDIEERILKIISS